MAGKSCPPHRPLESLDKDPFCILVLTPIDLLKYPFHRFLQSFFTRFAYLRVVLISLCPASSATVTISTSPFWTYLVQKYGEEHADESPIFPEFVVPDAWLYVFSA